MAIDRAKIMKDAWTIARRFAGNRETWGQRLSRALKSVWWDYKQAAREAARQEAYRAAQRAAFAAAAPRAASEIAMDIRMIESKDRLFQADWQALQALRTEMQAAA